MKCLKSSRRKFLIFTPFQKCKHKSTWYWITDERLAEKEGLQCQPRNIMNLSYFLEKGTLITRLLLFQLDLGLACNKVYRFVENKPVKSFKNFVPSAAKALRKRDQNPNSSVVAETMKLLANSSYGYQIMDRSRNTVIKFLSYEKTNGAINTNFFKSLDYINDQLYEVEMAKAEIEHRETIIVGFFTLQYAKLRMLELYFFFRDSLTSTKLRS